MMHWLFSIQKSAKIIVSVFLIIVLFVITAFFYLIQAGLLQFDSVYNASMGYTEDIVETEVEINFYTREIEDDKLDEGTSETQQEGLVGKKKRTYRVLKNKDGYEISREIIAEEVIAPAEDRVVIIGTKKTETNIENNSDAHIAPNANNSPNSQQYNAPVPSQQNKKLYYCTHSGYAEEIFNGLYRRMYEKRPKPCGWEIGEYYNSEVSESEFYSHKLVNEYNSNPSQYEHRYQDCEDRIACGCYVEVPNYWPRWSGSCN